MRTRCTAGALGTIAAVGVLVGVLAVAVPAAQTAATYKGPRSPFNDGHPDLSGIWQALNTAYWDLEDHPMAPGGLGPLDGAVGAVLPGRSVVVDPPDGKIPYQPSALEQRKKNLENRRKIDPRNRHISDPEVKCYMAGIPRSTYLNQPFQILQSPRYILMAYQYANSNRPIRMGADLEPPTDTWMGWSTGRWEGETLVVRTFGFNGRNWLDRAGNFASEKLDVTERFTLTGPDHMQYEAVLTDPTVFTRPWTIRMPLYRIKDKNAELLEFRCVELTEELIYGSLVKKAD